MKLSWNWLNDYVDLSGIKVDDVVHRLTMTTCEIEGYEPVFSHLDNVVCAVVIEKKKHPGADRLSVCTVRAGKDNHQVVCGAPNVREGMVVALAKVGARLPSAKVDVRGTLEIKHASIRGVDSYGMLCSAEELALTPLFGTTDGLIDLAAIGIEEKDWGSGRPLAQVLELTDIVLDIDNKSITHRPDLWSHFGFARELAGIYKKKIKFDPKTGAAFKAAPLPQKKIKIEKGAALSYFGLMCDNVTVNASPLWMKARLAAVGQKSISNIVDVSNYVMLELGQPNHAFDARTLKSDTVTVAVTGMGGLKAQPMKLLDETEITVPPGTILVIDGDMQGRPAALAGVMGGLDSAIAPDTTQIFLESATFPRESIRRTLSKLQLRTDSAVRFEKGQDPFNARPALLRIISLLKETCPGIRVGKITGSAPSPARRNRIPVPLTLLQNRLGFAITGAQAKAILSRMHFSVVEKKAKGTSTLTVTAPTFRSQYDITIPEDIVEEIGRVHGYDNIQPVAPPIACDSTTLNHERIFEREARNFLVQHGRFFETYNYSFSDPDDNALIGDKGLGIKNQMPRERSHLRTTLIPGLLRQAAANQDRFEEVRLCEFGRVYLKKGKPHDLADEFKRIALAVIPTKKNAAADSGILSSFLEFRAIMEAMLQDLSGGRVQIQPAGGSHPALHPGCAVQFVSMENGAVAGSAGLVHPALAARVGLKRPAFTADLDQLALFQLSEQHRTTSSYKPPSHFPDSYFELSVIMDSDQSTAVPLDVTRNTRIKEIQEITILDVYQGAPIPDGKMSVSYQFRISDPESTLSGERLQSIRLAVVAALADNGMPIRS